MNKKTIELLPPTMPLYLDYTGSDNPISVGDLTKEEAEEYAELMKQTFLTHWQERAKVVRDSYIPEGFRRATKEEANEIQLRKNLNNYL